MTVAVVGSSGGMKSVFVQGVLNALEAGGFRADCYAGASGSALPATGAAIGKCQEIGLPYWQRVHATRQQGNDMGETMLLLMKEWEHLHQHFDEMPRLIISASAVVTEEAAQLTQDESGARRLGRKLLVQAGRKDRSWVDEHLELHLFDTQAENEQLRLRVDNISDVAYASLRMLHTSKIPAWINGRPYVDTSYTSVCPVKEVAALGYDEVIAISTEPGDTLYTDIFQQDIIPPNYNGTQVHIIQPEFDLTDIGADYTDCTDDGVENAFRYGEEQGRKFLA